MGWYDTLSWDDPVPDCPEIEKQREAWYNAMPLKLPYARPEEIKKRTESRWYTSREPCTRLPGV